MPFNIFALADAIRGSFVVNFQVPNTVEFADWIGRTKQKQIRVTGSVMNLMLLLVSLLS